MTTPVTNTPFIYLAIKPSGGRMIGMRAAPNESSLAAALSAERLLLLRSRALPGWTSRRETFSLSDQAALNEQIGALVDRGVPLVEALEVAQSVVSKRAAPTVARLRDMVASGETFADACRRTGVFDEVVITVYRAAERSGQLGVSARRLAESARGRMGIRGTVITMMLYPGVVLAVGVIVTLVVMTQVVPRVAETLEQAGGIPWYTQAVIAAGQAMKTHWLFALGTLATILTLAIILRTLAVSLFLAAMRRAPLFGNVLITSESARFFSVMGAMTRTGVPLADALVVATGVISHPRLRAQLEDLGRGLVEGGVLKTLIEQMDALPLATRRLLIAADRAGDMDQVFDALATDLAAEVDVKTKRAVGLLEPMLIIAVFLIIGSVLFSVMLPLVTMGARIE